jgi:ammonium transporter, Amt family
MFKLIDKTIGLRVSPEEELEGLDYSEHGGSAYPDFEVISQGIWE